MTSLRTLLVCSALLGSFGALWNVLDARMDQRDEELRAAEETETLSRSMAAAQHRLEQARQEAREAATREARRKDRVLQRWGGPVGAALKNPELGIAESIEGLARALIPEATQVAVRVDRFVEFQLTIELPGPVSDSQMAHWSRELVTPLHRYLHTIRFVTSSAVVGELDRLAIEAAAQANGDGSARIQELLQRLRQRVEGRSEGDSQESVAAAGDAQRQEPQRSAESTNAAVASDPGFEREIRVNAEHSAAMEAQFQALGEGLRELHYTIDRLGKHGHPGLAPARESIQRFREALPKIRVQLVDPAGELDRRLKEVQVDEVYRRAAVRTLSQDYTATRDAERMIAHARRYSDVLLAFVDTMEKHRAGWTALPEVEKVQFLDSDLFEIYREAALACEREQKETQAAIQAWQAEVQKGQGKPMSR